MTLWEWKFYMVLIYILMTAFKNNNKTLYSPGAGALVLEQAVD